MKQTLMTRIGALAAFVFAALLGSLPASAASFIQDGAQMFSPDTVAQLNTKISNFNAQTGKEIVVVTVPSLNGETVADAAHQVFNEQHVNGVLIFIAKNDRRDIIVPGNATAQFFPQATNASIRQSMESLFKAEDYDGGVTAAVNGVLDVFRAHLNQQAPGANYPATTSQTTLARSNSGAHIPVFMWIIILVIGYLVLRSIFRAMSGPRYYGGPGAGPGMPGPGYPPAGYGGPGYYGGGGGGFWSGLLGGLGGAWLGNELFGNRGGNTIIEQGGNAPMVSGGDQGGGWGGGNAGGWGQDSGADMGNASSGDWSGGGFGGGGDSGGGCGGFGGGDSGGGGGGDSGGGW